MRSCGWPPRLTHCGAGSAWRSALEIAAGYAGEARLWDNARRAPDGAGNARRLAIEIHARG
jgi:hypothetical protein